MPAELKNAAHRAGVWVRQRGARAQLANHLHDRGCRLRGDRRRPGLEVPDQRRHPGREEEGPRHRCSSRSTQIARGTVFDQALTDKLFDGDADPAGLAAAEPDPAGHRRGRCSTVYKGKVAATDIFTGHARSWPTSSCSASQLVSTVAGAIPKGKQAITVSLDQTHAVGGFVTPGDQVNVILNSRRDRRGKRRRATGAHRRPRSCCPGLKVIAVGSSTVLPTAVAARRPPRHEPTGAHDHDAAAEPAAEPDHARR